MKLATITVNIGQILQNIEAIQSGLSNSVKTLLVAKANAYGLGSVPICQALQSCVDYIGVATIHEALDLRRANVTCPILLFCEPCSDDFECIAKHDITVTIHQPDTIQQLDTFLNQSNYYVKSHFKIDTGMSRLGQHWATCEDAITTWLNTSDRLIKDGIYSHFANSDSPCHPLNNQQLSRFETVTQSCQHITRHMANSQAIQTIKHAHLDLIRIGLHAYQQAFQVSAPVKHIQSIPKHTCIGYGSTYETPTDCDIATLGIGYADGISTRLSNQGHVSIDGHECPIVGRICMDMMMVKLPKNHAIRIGTPATIIANGSEDGLTIDDVARITDLNPREIMCQFSNRMIREYTHKPIKSCADPLIIERRL